MGYRGKIDEQNRARELRAQGWTLGEICEELGVSKASASLWCRDVVIDEDALAERRRARNLAGNEGARARGPNKLQRRKQAEIAEGLELGRHAVGELSDRDLLIAGLMLYAGEGGKRDGSVNLANSDPRTIRFFCAWLRRFFDVDESRLRVQLYLHEGLDLAAAVTFWSELTTIPVAQFGKPYRAVPDASIRRSKHPMGCQKVAYSCSTTHRRIMGMIAALLASPTPDAASLGDAPSADEIGPG